jgi:hypothetical protein
MGAASLAFASLGTGGHMAPPPSRRFHIDSGPPELFERIRFIIGRRGPQNLDLSKDHAAERTTERSFPTEIVTPFRPEEWELLTAEVLPSGKFMRTTWARMYEGQRWLVTFAKGDIVITGYKSDPRRTLDGPSIVRSGEFFETVARVNRDLMAAESDGAGA